MEQNKVEAKGIKLKREPSQTSSQGESKGKNRIIRTPTNKVGANAMDKGGFFWECVGKSVDVCIFFGEEGEKPKNADAVETRVSRTAQREGRKKMGPGCLGVNI